MSSPNKSSIDEKLAELEKLLGWFENEDEFKFDQALDKYNQARKIADEINQQLNELKNKLIEV